MKKAGIEKLEAVEAIYKAMGFDFKGVTIDQAFRMFHQVEKIIESNKSEVIINKF